MNDVESAGAPEIVRELRRIAGELTNEYLDRPPEGYSGSCAYFCTYVPEELLMAAGLVPYRVRALPGAASAGEGDFMTAATTCSFCRACLGAAMAGDYPPFEGLINLHSCDHARRVADYWRREFPPDFFYRLDTPRLNDERGVKYFEGRLAGLAKALAEHVGRPVDGAPLAAAIRTCNETRRLLRELDLARRAEDSPLGAGDVLAAHLAACSMPKERANELLGALVARLPSAERKPGGCRARVLFTGSVVDDVEYLDRVEEVGAKIAADFLDFGERYRALDVKENGAPLAALAERYLARPSCPRFTDDFDRRAGQLIDLAREAEADGVVCAVMKFCDSWGWESERLSRALEKEGLPLLILEREHGQGGTGQLRTRVQAFIERLGK